MNEWLIEFFVPAKCLFSLFLSHLFTNRPEARYPDSVAVTYDPANLWLSCVYNDHSLYVWDVQDLRTVGKVYSGLYHSACVWDLQVHFQEWAKPIVHISLRL